jgi:hypothetical protein
VLVPQGHAPHPPELQRLQTFRGERPTLPTSTSSPSTRRTWRTSTTPAAGGGGAFPRVDKEVNVIFGGHGSQESKRQQKLNDRQILVAAIGPPAPYRWSKHPITFTRTDQWLNFDHLGKYPLLVDPVIQESRVKKVLVDEGSSINVTFPGRSKAWEFPSKKTRKKQHSSDCYSGYHQISLAKEDEEKTAFITPFGAFCYTSMSFGLKNAGATYQRAI